MKKIVLYVLFLLFVSSILFGTTTITASHNALYLWATTLVPSFLFPLIFVRLLTPYHLLYPFLKPLNPLFLFLFKIDAKAMETILTALLLGFPSATMYLDEIAKTNHLTKQQYQRFINIIFLASPNFILLSLSVLY
ncbi:MAG: hypothetical protein EOM50_16935, partial [Erysipelotrichia bacterium]|nr:hypothetical protein [Erysipelotrichia bacterium]